MSRTVKCFTALLLFLLSMGLVGAEAPKLVVLGFDGADARLVEQWMDAGELPHLAELREQGTFAELTPTNPPQTPVSWSSFATGLDPGKTEIFDFLNRKPSDYLPDFAMISEGRRPFLAGERNGMVVGGIGGAAVFIVLFGLLIVARLGWRVRMAVAAVIAVAAGFGLSSVAREYLPVEIPTATNNRKGTPFWEMAGAAGLTSKVIRVPATFPAAPIDNGNMVSGLGVPDMRGRIGTPSFYTSDPNYAVDDDEFSLERLQLPARRGVMETRLVGPLNKPFYDYVIDARVAAGDPADARDIRKQARRDLDDAEVPNRLDLPIDIEVTDSSATFTIDGQTQTLELGEWSDWYELNFPVNPVVDAVSPLSGMVKVKLLQLEPEFEFYISPVNFHPDCHPVAHTWPPDYASELKERFGLYKTLGWALDTWSLPSGVGDESLFLEDMAQTVSQYEKVMEGLLADGDNDLYVQIFYFTDRIGHLFWRFLDPQHPLYDAEMAARYEGEMLKAYKRMDSIVGKARSLVGPETEFLICSDHGFSSYRRGVNINNWLVDNGLMTLKHRSGPASLEKLFDTRELFVGVDWSKTKAYSMGLGSIYINLLGREKHGIVLPGPEYEEVVKQIQQGLESIVDEQTGAHPVARVWTRDEMYQPGYDPNLIPDLRAGNSDGYRVSWQTSLGGFGDTLIEDNTKPWSGDHCSLNPEEVKGIFFSTFKINTEEPRMVDLMPTILDVLDVAVPEELDGRTLR